MAATPSNSTTGVGQNDAARTRDAVAAARKVLTLVYYGLRDGEIPSVAPPEAA